MRYRTLTMSTLALASGAILAPQAGAGVRWTPSAPVQIDTCTLVAQPWNHTTYGLEITHADGTVETLLEQTYAWLDDTRWTFPAGDLQTIRWARDVTTWAWLDTYQVTDDCRFETPYRATPGKQDSLVLEAGFAPVPTTTTTSTPAPTTSTTAAPPGQTTTTAPYTDQTVAVEPPVVTTWATTPPPETTTSTTPEANTSSTPVVELSTTDQLPFTGDHTGMLGTVGAAAVALGLAFVAKARRLA